VPNAYAGETYTNTYGETYTYCETYAYAVPNVYAGEATAYTAVYTY